MAQCLASASAPSVAFLLHPSSPCGALIRIHFCPDNLGFVCYAIGGKSKSFSAKDLKQD